MGYDEWYAPKAPRKARGGIKAASRRGDFAENWWGSGWIEALESLPAGARWARGKNYARRGQVLSLEVRGGTVEARVQGTRVRPYRCCIDITPWGEDTWERVKQVVGEHAYLAAALLGGRVPPELEDALRREGLSLFPFQEGRLAMACSCPDYSVPCKHLAAVVYLLGERLDQDPFLLFELQGMPRREILRRVGVEGLAPEEGPSSLETLPGNDGEAFWKGGPLPPIPETLGKGDPAALLRQLGPFPLWRGDEPLEEALAPVYRAVRDKWAQGAGGATPGTSPD